MNAWYNELKRDGELPDKSGFVDFVNFDFIYFDFIYYVR